jgi:hypothetical protein
MPFAVPAVEVAKSPFAVEAAPYAVAATPVAFALRPTAVELVPVAAVTSHDAVPRVPSVPEKHAASAGETPSAVIIPAAAAMPRSVPPHRKLLASRWARRSRE